MTHSNSSSDETYTLRTLIQDFVKLEDQDDAMEHLESILESHPDDPFAKSLRIENDTLTYKSIDEKTVRRRAYMFLKEVDLADINAPYTSGSQYPLENETDFSLSRRNVPSTVDPNRRDVCNLIDDGVPVKFIPIACDILDTKIPENILCKTFSEKEYQEILKIWNSESGELWRNVNPRESQIAEHYKKE